MYKNHTPYIPKRTYTNTHEHTHVLFFFLMVNIIGHALGFETSSKPFPGKKL